jgi:hypothetical protein
MSSESHAAQRGKLVPLTRPEMRVLLNMIEAERPYLPLQPGPSSALIEVLGRGLRLLLGANQDAPPA